MHRDPASNLVANVNSFAGLPAEWVRKKVCITVWMKHALNSTCHSLQMISDVCSFSSCSQGKFEVYSNFQFSGQWRHCKQLYFLKSLSIAYREYTLWYHAVICVSVLQSNHNNTPRTWIGNAIYHTIKFITVERYHDNLWDKINKTLLQNYLKTSWCAAQI